MLSIRIAEQSVAPHLTDAAQARRRRLGTQFARAASTDEESLANARAMLETLKRDSRWKPAPAR
jgi:hypothetical protein